jgi:hypothetical protein
LRDVRSVKSFGGARRILEQLAMEGAKSSVR